MSAIGGRDCEERNMRCQIKNLYRPIRFAHPGIRQVSPTPGAIFFNEKLKLNFKSAVFLSQTTLVARPNTSRRTKMNPLLNKKH